MGKNNAKIKKSSPEARRLIAAALRASKKKSRDGKPSLRIAAALIHLPNHGQLQKMREGTMRDTPAMRAELKRRLRKAEIAYQRELITFYDDAPLNRGDVIPLLKVVEKLIGELLINCVKG